MVKIDPYLLQPIRDRLDAFAERLYQRGGAVMAVVELTAVEKTAPFDYDDDEQRAGKVALRITGCEVASAAQEPHLRRVQEALYRIRTSSGTLDEQLSGADVRRLEMAGGVLLGDAGLRG